jgi:succinate dehydrogenase / fumarate reductase flavoprotein subunit
VFATGGFGKIFKTTSNAHTLTGDGVGIIYRKGLPLEDMEFYQFHPTGLAGLGILLSEAARGEGAILRNASGERFMERYAPTIKDLAPRDMVARAMANEVREGRGAGPHKDYVLLDLTHLEPAVIDAKLPDITEFARTYLGLETMTQLCQVYMLLVNVHVYLCTELTVLELTHYWISTCSVNVQVSTPLSMPRMQTLLMYQQMLLLKL